MQSQVYVNLAFGEEGKISRLNPITKLPMIAESGVVCGKFGFAGTDPEKQIKGVSAEATEVAGFVVYENMQANLTGTDTLAVSNGREVALLLKGYAYCRPTTLSTKGQAVFVNPKTGAIQTAASGSTIEDFIETPWKVETGAPANQVCEIYNI